MANIESLITDLPNEWKDKISMDFAKMKAESPSIIDLEVEMKRFTTSVIIQPDAQTRQKIYETISPLAGKFKGLFIQPPEGYHFSVQWSDNLLGDRDKLIAAINSLEIPQLETDIKLVYPSKPNLFAVVLPKNDSLWMSNLRQKVSELLKESGYTPKLPETLPTIWMSLVRFTDDFDPAELDNLVNSLPETTFNCREFTLYLAESNPFFSKATAKIFSSRAIPG